MGLNVSQHEGYHRLRRCTGQSDATRVVEMQEAA